MASERALGVIWLLYRLGNEPKSYERVCVRVGRLGLLGFCLSSAGHRQGVVFFPEQLVCCLHKLFEDG